MACHVGHGRHAQEEVNCHVQSPYSGDAGVSRLQVDPNSNHSNHRLVGLG